MKDIHIELAFPPTVNSYYTKTQRGIYISKRGRVFRELAAEACLQQGVYNLSLTHPLTVDVILYPPDRRTRDLDNYMKALLDALTIAKVWEDDSLIDNLNIHRGVVVSKQEARASVRIADHHGLILPNSLSVWDYIE